MAEGFGGTFARMGAHSSIGRLTAARDLVWDAPRTFYGAPGVELDALDAQVAFLGVPYDGGTPQPGNRTGQAGGPAAARLQSWEQFEYGPQPEGGALGWYDIETGEDHLVGVTMADIGDVAIQGADDLRNFDRMTETIRRIVERGALPVAFGGDHSISFPLGRGMGAFPAIDVVSFDAHADYFDDLDGARYTGASEMRRLHELPFVRSVTMLGLRNVTRLEVDAMRASGVTWATSLDLERDPVAAVRRTVPSSDALYLSIDLDVLDLSVAPATSLPEPGGPRYRDLRLALAEVALRGRVVWIDVVVLSPGYDITRSTARTATWLVTHLLSECFRAR